MVFVQCAHCATAHHHGQLVRTQAHALTQGIAGLQGEGAQTERHRKACSFLRVCQAVHDAGIGQCFSTARRGHIDTEEALFLAGRLQGGSQVKRFVLPSESATATALFESPVVVNARQTGIDLGQAASDTVNTLFHTNQVFVQALL